MVRVTRSGYWTKLKSQLDRSIRQSKWYRTLITGNAKYSRRSNCRAERLSSSLPWLRSWIRLQEDCAGLDRHWERIIWKFTEIGLASPAPSWRALPQKA